MNHMLGKKGETKQVRTVTVIGSSVAASPTGVVAIVLDTKESGPIGFAVTLEACVALRNEIAAAETFLRHQQGKA
jgi:hypothetical protein